MFKNNKIFLEIHTAELANRASCDQNGTRSSNVCGNTLRQVDKFKCCILFFKLIWAGDKQNNLHVL